MRGKLIAVLIAGPGILAAVVVVRAYLRHSEAELMEHKMVRTTTGVVLEKKHVRFAADQTEYQNDEGRTVHLENWRKNSGELRVFYKIDNFDQIIEPHRSAVLTAEEERGKRFGPRFRIVDQSTFDQAERGEVVHVTYRWAGNSKIEIVSLELATQHSDRKL